MLTNTEIQEIIAAVDEGTYDIASALNDIATAAKGEDVRKALYAEAYTLNKEGHAGSTDLRARERIAQLNTAVNDLDTDKADMTAVEAVDARMNTLIEQVGSENRETVLFSGNIVGTGAIIALSDSITNYDYIDVYVDKQGATEIRTIPASTSVPYCLRFTNVPDDTSSRLITLCEFWLQPVSANSYTISKEMSWEWNGASGSNAETIAIPESSTHYSAAKITRIVGRKNNEQFVNAELEDIRIAADGMTYQTAGSAVRGQVSNINSRIGDLSELETEDKTDLVSAINEAASSGGGGLTEAIKTALLQLASKVAYIDANGQTYYNVLYNALYPPAELVSIAAVYTQSGTVYDSTPLDDLKADLVVTATYDDSTEMVVPGTDYILSGTLAVGTSTITASYGGKETTFNVTVTDNSILNVDITMGRSAQTIYDQEIVYDTTKTYSFIYTFGSHTPVQTATTPNAVVGPAASNNTSKGGSIQWLGSGSTWRTIINGGGQAFTPVAGDILCIVHSFPEAKSHAYLNGELIRSGSDTVSWFNDTAKVYVGGDNANMTVAPVHIKIAEGDLH